MNLLLCILLCILSYYILIKDSTAFFLALYISWEMTLTSIGGEKQACISGGVNPPADIASGRIAEVRSRSMSCNCMTRTSQQECRGILAFLTHTKVMNIQEYFMYIIQMFAFY